MLAAGGTAIAGYLLGSISFGIISTYLFTKKDIRSMGSANTGMTNVLRSVGLVAGLITGIGDFTKGIGAVILGRWLFTMAGLTPNIGAWLAAACVIFGHIFPLYNGFKGGKAVMTSAGILIVLDFRIFLIVMGIFLITFVLSRIVSLSALVAATATPIASFCVSYFSNGEWVYITVFSALIAALLFITLRDNIKRLRAGTEPKLVVQKQTFRQKRKPKQVEQKQ